jgi:hypothetical protein
MDVIERVKTEKARPRFRHGTWGNLNFSLEVNAGHYSSARPAYRAKAKSEVRAGGGFRADA